MRQHLRDFDAGLPIAIVNRGRTRGDELATLKVEGDVGTVLMEAIVERVDSFLIRQDMRGPVEEAGTVDEA